jgi:ribosome biogenesis GTPase
LNLEDLGWKPVHAQAFAGLSPAWRPARVLTTRSATYRVQDLEGERTASATGQLREGTRSSSDLPVVGDWVALEPNDAGQGVIHAVLPRTAFLSRKAAGRTRELQPLAANVDRVLIVMGLDADFNLRRLERALVMVAQSGAAATLVLNKCDLETDVEVRRRAAEEIAAGIPVLTLSAKRGDGLEGLGPYLQPGETLVLLGSSGAGKSTLTNRLLGTARQDTGPVREHDQRGRHTTTTRELMLLPCGALLIDTPGIREIQLTAAEVDVDVVFADVARVALGCRFRDCRHESEPGCAVQAAVARGELAAGHVANLQKLEREIESRATRSDPARSQDGKARQKALQKAQRQNRRDE